MDLLKVVETLSLSKVKHLINKKGMPSNASYNDYKALNRSIELQRKDIAMFLLDSKCRTNIPKLSESSPKLLCTPLHKAVKLGDMELVQKLLSKNASVTALNFEGNSPLHLSFILGYRNITKVILNCIKSTATYINPKNKYGLSHFHIACSCNNSSVFWGFMNVSDVSDLDSFVESDSPIYANYSAIQFAVEFQSVTVLKLLLDRGKGFSQSHVQVALEQAKQNLNNSSVMVELLSIHSQPSFQKELSQFHIACMKDNPALINSFLSHGTLVNEPVSEEVAFCTLYTPLHFAIENDCFENVKLLLQYGAQVNICNADYMTPMHLALYSGNSVILDLIYKSTLNKIIECTDCNGLNYFHVAVAQNDIARVKKFLANEKNDINAVVLHNNRNFSGYTPLHFAVRYGHLAMAKLLIEAGANMDINDMERHGTPLHIAASSGCIALINLLLNKGASVTTQRLHDLKNVLHLLVEAYLDDDRKPYLLPCIKKFILDRGLDVNSKDCDGYTPLHYACMKLSEGAPCVELLLKCGADINIVNKFKDTAFSVAFYDFYDNNAKDCLLLYDHVMALKALGLPVNRKNEDCCLKLIKKYQNGADCFKFEQLNSKQKQRTSEIEKMKKLKVSRKTSIYDFIVKDEKKLHHFVRTHSMTEFIKSATIDKLSNYGFLVRLRLLRLQKLQSTGALL